MMEQPQFEKRVRQLVLQVDRRLPVKSADRIWSLLEVDDYLAAIELLVESISSSEVRLYERELSEISEIIEAIGMSTEVLRGIEAVPDLPALSREEFADRVRGLISRLLPEVEGDSADLIRRAGNSGAWDVAVPELAAIIEQDQLPISVVDAIELRHFLLLLGLPELDLDRLNVKSDFFRGRQSAIRALLDIAKESLPDIKFDIVRLQMDETNVKSTLLLLIQRLEARHVLVSPPEIEALWYLGKQYDVPTEKIEHLEIARGRSATR